MSIKDAPKIRDYSKGQDYVEIRFTPDYQRFKLKNITNDLFGLFKKRVFDLAGVMGKKVRVFFNQEELQISSFEDYAKLYFEPDQVSFMIPYSQPRWEIIVTQSKGQFEQVSFVNSINTYRGGTHVNFVADKLIENLTKEINKKKPKLKIKPYVIKNNLYIFINCLIENPTFDTQTKEYLTLKQSSFGSSFDFNANFFKKLLATDIIDQIIQIAEAKENQQMAKALKGVKRARLFGIEKLEDANKAGTSDS
jgi:DNA topoisomerase-2